MEAVTEAGPVTEPAVTVTEVCPALLVTGLEERLTAPEDENCTV